MLAVGDAGRDRFRIRKRPRANVPAAGRFTAKAFFARARRNRGTFDRNGRSMTNFIKKKIQIRNPQGLHARPASVFVRIANKFESDVTVKKDGENVNGKSIMGLLTLAANQGSWLEIEISGADA